MKSLVFNSNQHLRDANPSYSFCRCCGKPWNLVAPKNVQTNSNSGTFATCIDCWNVSSLDELKQYFAEVYIDQKESLVGTKHKMEHSLERLLFSVEIEWLKQ